MTASKTPTGRRQQRAKSERAAALAEDDAPVPDDIDEFRRALARKIMTVLGLPARCREPRCRRHKRCVGRDLRCQRDFPGPPVTADERAAVLAQVQKALRRRIEAEGGG